MEANTERCPLCGTELSAIKFREIQSKLQEEEHRKTTEIAKFEAATRQKLEQQFNLTLEKRIQAAEKKAKEETEQQFKKVVAERDQANKKLRDAQGREAEILKQAREEFERQHQKELTHQRQVLEVDKAQSLLKQQSAAARDRDALLKKVQNLENQLKKKTANELGDGAEIDLFEALRECFPGDKITRIPKGQAGADILHEVLYRGEACGRIIIDSKNRQSWQNGFVMKLRQDQVAAGAEHAILATTVFPAGNKEMCIESGVIVMTPARVVYIAQLLRQTMVRMHIQGLSIKERTTKMSRLYKLITSESYAGKLTEANKLTQDILDLEVQEKTAHDNVWKKRGAIAKRIHNVLREAETEVAAIIEGNDGGEAPPAFPAKSTEHNGTSSREAVVWTKH